MPLPPLPDKACMPNAWYNPRMDLLAELARLNADPSPGWTAWFGNCKNSSLRKVSGSPHSAIPPKPGRAVVVRSALLCFALLCFALLCFAA